MTKKEANLFYESWLRNNLAVFESYYKYTFYWVFQADQGSISLSYGGSSDDIYRFEVSGPEIKLPIGLSDLEERGYSYTITDISTGKSFNHWA